MTGLEDDDPPPIPPRRPDNDECCGGGCNPCIFDAYEDARERYEAALAAWRARHERGDAAGGGPAAGGKG
jgi:hypothetical protein